MGGLSQSSESKTKEVLKDIKVCTRVVSSGSGS